MDFLNQLNNSQREAVTYTEGASLIVAGAGSGKTRVLTYRIAYLLQQAVPASRIMALTFTNKAAREMKERITKLVGAEARYLAMGTFHSICTRLIRPYAELLGYTRDFTIYDTPDSKSVIKAICKERGLDEKIYKPGAVQARISMAKNSGVGPRAYAQNTNLLREDRELRMYEFPAVYELYEARLKAANAMDFDDLLINMLRLMEVSPEVKQKYQQQFQYILVDEYQDTNYIQFLLVKQLAEPQNNICVVGDDAQSIYSFRGADIRNILNFQRVYPQAKLFKLEQNYRSTQNIVNAANSLIHKNIHQIEKTVYSEKEEGQPLNLQPYMDDRTEALGVASKIQRMKFKGYDSFAVLYRTNAQSRVIEGELRKLNIPYRIYGGTSFYQRKEIKDAIAYFRLSINPNDDEALKRVINYPARSIGETTVNKLVRCAIDNRVSIWHIICNLDKFEVGINSGTAKKLNGFRELISSFIEFNNQDLSADIVAENIIRETKLLSCLLSDRTPESISKQENLSELINGVKEFVASRLEEGNETNTTLIDFLAEVSLATDQDTQETPEERVTLMTVHAAKGLEFSNVFIVGAEEELFPSAMSSGSLQEIEEERRLMYVAITRAKNFCMISYASSRFRNGQTVTCSPSRFIRDIDPQYLHLCSGTSIDQQRFNPIDIYKASFHSRTYTSTTQQRKTQISNDSQNSLRQSVKPQNSSDSNLGQHISSELQAGLKIEHSRFGTGTITNIDTNSTDHRITVVFDNVGEKTLLLKFAKFKIIG